MSRTSRKCQFEFSRSRVLCDGIWHWRKRNKYKKYQVRIVSTRNILETDSSAAKASAERPDSCRMKHMCVEYHLGQNDYRFDVVQNKIFRINKKLQ